MALISGLFREFGSTDLWHSIAALSDVTDPWELPFLLKLINPAWTSNPVLYWDSFLKIVSPLIECPVYVYLWEMPCLSLFCTCSPHIRNILLGVTRISLGLLVGPNIGIGPVAIASIPLVIPWIGTSPANHPDIGVRLSFDCVPFSWPLPLPVYISTGQGTGQMLVPWTAKFCFNRQMLDTSCDPCEWECAGKHPTNLLKLSNLEVGLPSEWTVEFPYENWGYWYICSKLTNLLSGATDPRIWVPETFCCRMLVSLVVPILLLFCLPMILFLHVAPKVISFVETLGAWKTLVFVVMGGLPEITVCTRALELIQPNSIALLFANDFISSSKSYLLCRDSGGLKNTGILCNGGFAWNDSLYPCFRIDTTQQLLPVFLKYSANVPLKPPLWLPRCPRNEPRCCPRPLMYCWPPSNWFWFWAWSGRSWFFSL